MILFFFLYHNKKRGERRGKGKRKAGGVGRNSNDGLEVSEIITLFRYPLMARSEVIETIKELFT
jgi:hypothetical protein